MYCRKTLFSLRQCWNKEVLVDLTKFLGEVSIFKEHWWASLVAQWLRACLLMRGTRVRALVWEDPTCRGSDWVREPQLLSLRVWDLCSATRGCDSERPAHRDEEWPPLAATRGSPSTEMTQHSNQSINQTKKKKRALVSDFIKWCFLNLLLMTSPISSVL